MNTLTWFGMTVKLYFVGFNGYSQCPDTCRNDLPKVITQWTHVEMNELLGTCCTHRFLIIETKTTFLLHGLISEVKECKAIEKPCKIDCFNSNEEYLMACEGVNLWLYPYRRDKWSKLELTIPTGEHEKVWKEDGNKIVKLSFRMDTSDVFLLLSNGSVWRLKEQQTLELLYPYDVDKAIDLSSGLEHTLILTESGCVLTFGNGSRGQLGNGNLNSTHRPVQVESLEGLKATRISAGNWHSCVITDSGDLCTWGWNTSGQLAAFENGEEVGLTATPTFVDVGEDSEVRVVDVACGSRHTLAKLENGDLHGAGWNIYGQLGLGTTSEKTAKFQLCQLRGNQKRQILAGPWYTIALETNGATSQI